MHNQNNKILKLWEILVLWHLTNVSQEIINTGFKDVGSLRRKITGLLVILNHIEVSINWNLELTNEEDKPTQINPQQLNQTLTEITEWIETNYPMISKIDF